MTEQPTLSIVIPTRGDFEGVGCNKVLELEGDIEFVIVHPPDTEMIPFEDDRVKQIISPIRGEVVQRCTGLLNTTGKFVVTLDQDQILRPNIVGLVERYFSKYPDSWVFRSYSVSDIPVSDLDKGESVWVDTEDIEAIKISGRQTDNYRLFEERKALGEIPIVPLKKTKLDLRCIFWPFFERKDQCSYHIENFNKKVWKGDMVREAAGEVGEAFKFMGAFKYIPFWCMDRLMGLWIQAKFFEEDRIVGHYYPNPFYLAIKDDSQLVRKGRFYMASDILLLKKFPKYGYFWNLAFSHFWGIVRRGVNKIKGKIKKEG